MNVNRYYVSSAFRGKCNANIVRMGVICHELGHYLGLPDLYDSTFEGAGLGAYDYMSQSWGFDGSGKYPPNLCAWSKLHVGWAKATLIQEDGEYTISASGVGDGSLSNKVYKIQAGFPNGEYLLIENRQPIGYDVKIERGGIAIYHVDDNVDGQGVRGYPSSSTSGWPKNGHHYQVALLSADGKYDLERGVNQGDSGDLWSRSTSSSTMSGLLNELKAGSDQYPNTDSYQNGIVTETGIRIYGFSESGNTMTFKVEGLPPATTDEIVVNEEEEGEVVSTTMTTPPPTTAKPTTPSPTTAKPTTSQPTSKAPTNAPTTLQPTPSPTSKPTPSPTSKPTSSPTTETQLCTNLCLVPITPDECPSDIITAQLPDCTSSSSPSSTGGVQIGELCDADGECNSDQFLDNCLFYDVYRRVDCSTMDATIIVDGGTPQFEGDDILPDSNIISTSRPTSPPSFDTLTTLDDNNNDCPYYPGWNQGLSHCLKDCHQPSYMQGNPTFEFKTLEQCCELHYAGTVSCKTESVLAMEASYANTKFAKITGQVWNDENGNDWQDASERGMGDGVHGVLVDLYDCSEYTSDGSGSSSWVKGTRTSLDGSYVFDTIYTPGSYYVQITVPSGYTLSQEQSWLAETEYDSDFNILGRSECIEFGSSDDGSDSKLDLMLDAGLIPNALATTTTSPPPTSQPTTSKPTTVEIAVEAVSQAEDQPAMSAAASFSASGMHSKSASSSYSTLDSSVTIEQVTPSFLRGSSSNTDDVVLVYPTSEATIHSQQDMKFIGGEDELLVGPQLSWQDDILLKFDLSDGLSPSQQDYRAAKQAVLSLYSLTSSQSGGAVHSASSNVDWDASSVTWSTAPKAGHVLGTIGETKPNSWIEVDVTGLLLSEDGHVTLRITSEKNNHSWVAKYSSSSSNESNVPVLKVYF